MASCEDSTNTRIPAFDHVGPENESGYISFGSALEVLRGQLTPAPTPEEVAMWIALGRELGGLHAFESPHDCGCPAPRFEPQRYFFHSMDADTEDYVSDRHYLRSLKRLFFSEKDVFSFRPEERFLTWTQLRDRWDTKKQKRLKNDVLEMIYKEQLYAMHPADGASHRKSADILGPALEAGLFPLSQVEAIEAEFPGVYSKAVSTGAETCATAAREHRAVSRYSEQKHKILRELQSLDCVPDALPETANGKAGVRTKVWERFTENGNADRFGTRHNFNKVWQRMRDEGVLKTKTS